MNTRAYMHTYTHAYTHTHISSHVCRYTHAYASMNSHTSVQDGALSLEMLDIRESKYIPQEGVSHEISR